MRNARISIAAAALCALSTVVAQDARGRVRGTVKTTEGTPWPGAQVVLVSTPFQADRRAGAPDVVRVASDAEGRFAAKLLRGRPYSTWAHSSVEKGLYRVTTVREGVMPGLPVHLQEEVGKRAVARVRILLSERWMDRAPLRFEALAEIDNSFAIPLVFDKDGVTTLPPLPAGRCHIEASGSDGRAFFSRALALPRAFTASPTVFELPVRYPLLVQLRTKKGRKPVGGIKLFERTYHRTDGRSHVYYWSHAGTTDEEGLARCRVIGDQSNATASRTYIFIRTQGKACGLRQFGKNMRLRANRKINEAKPDFSSFVEDGHTIRGRLLRPDGTPAAGLSIVVWGSLGNSRARAFYLNIEPVFLETDADGKFESPGWGPRFQYRVCALAGEALAAQLGSSARTPCSPVLWLAHGVGEGDVDLGNFDLGKLAAIDIEVRQADGFPAVGAELLLGEHTVAKLGKEKVTLRTNLPLRFLLGRRGRLRLLLPAVGALNLVAALGGSVASRELAEPRKSGALALRLDQGRVLRGKVVNPTGKPVPGAMIYANPARPPRVVDQALMTWVFPRPHRADRNGLFAIPLAFDDMSYWVTARIQIGKVWHKTQQVIVEVLEGEALQAVELVVPVSDDDLGLGKKK